MREITLLLKCLVSLLMIGIGIMCSFEGGPKAAVIGIACATVYFGVCTVAPKFVLARRDFYIRSHWELIKIKVGVGLPAAFVTCLLLSLIFYGSWD